MTADPQKTISPSAMDIRAQAADWLMRETADDWQPADQTMLDNWLAASPAHKIAYLRVKAAWSHTYRLAILKLPLTPRLSAPSARPDQTRPWLRNLRRVAAGFALLMLLGSGGALYLHQSPEQIYTTALGGRKTIQLADGTAVDLNTNTKLRVRYGLFQRKLWLDRGEAYFDVAHESHRSFILWAGHHRVTDLGTRFTVRQEKDQFRVALLDGVVLYDDETNPRSQPLRLAPGDEITATATSLIRQRKSLADLQSALGWKKGLLIFDNATLAEAAREFNRYNQKKLIIATSGAARRTIGASFRASDIDLFARMARNVLHLTVEDHGNQIIITD